MMNSRDRDPVDYERSVRSVFVGNIPYEASEEQLKDVFNEVGNVVSFRLVFDRESGKPKGYGFAEYQDQETAMSAMRNLNGRELHGRSLRVDHATSEKNRNNFQEDVDNFRAMGPPTESEYGEPTSSQDAPEAISKAVASLPPEQMFELMKQMKQCIQNNPVEARNMLLQNPQLAYALLQAQVVMRIVDPEIAMKMLHRQNAVQPLVGAGDGPARDTEPRPNGGQVPGLGGFTGDRPREPIDARDRDVPMDIHPERSDRLPPRRMDIERIPVDQGLGDPLDRHVDRHRPPHMEPRSRSPDRFGRGPRDAHFPDRGPPMDRGMPIMDRGLQRDRGPIMDRGRSSSERGRSSLERAVSPHRGPPVDRRGPPMERPGHPMDHGPPTDGGPRMRGPRGGPPMDPGIDPRMGRSGELESQTQEPDEEKAALIKQVLQLTPEQIKMLPEEQRQSILALKDQIQGGHP